MTTLLQIDAFTDTPFAGNPAAVCLLDAPADAEWMQAVASEMNLAETAFVVTAPAQLYGLRWFTPAVEVPLCGHATLASAHALWQQGIAPAGEAIAFDTLSGVLTATPEGDLITLDLPADRPSGAPVPASLVPALDVEPVRVTGSERGWWLVELADEAAVRAVAPDMRALAADHLDVIVTAPAAEGSGAAIASRVFAPALGIPEDPVTGAAHTLLASWWAPRIGPEFVAHQVSARGGELHVRLDGDRALIGGRAVTVLRGELCA